MKQLRLLGLLCVLGALAVGAGIAYAALGDTQSASGSVNVSTTSADLYICEPGNVTGPACGPDDSDGDEAVFETPEDMRPGDVSVWNIRLKNIGTTPFVVTSGEVEIVETNDPDNNCPVEALVPSGPEDNYWSVTNGISVVGKAGDPINDNDTNQQDLPHFRTETGFSQIPIYIAPGDYEDIRLRVRLQIQGTANCDGNTWDVAWNFEVN